MACLELSEASLDLIGLKGTGGDQPVDRLALFARPLSQEIVDLPNRQLALDVTPTASDSDEFELNSGIGKGSAC